MGALALLADEQHATVSDPAPVPRDVCFSDPNPVTGELYCESRFADLPDFVAWLVTERLGFERHEWDGLVAVREVAERMDIHREFPIPAWVRIKRDRRGRLREEVHVSDLGDAAAWL